MGWYHEPRVPQGEPALNEKDVWLEGGEIKFGHWDGAAWVVEATVTSAGLLGEKGATGDEGPPCPTGGNADTLDGYHGVGGSWVNCTPDTCYAGEHTILKCRSLGVGLVHLHGELVCDNLTGNKYYLGTIPAGMRPYSKIENQLAVSIDGSIVKHQHLTIYTDGRIKCASELDTTFGINDMISFDIIFSSV